MSLFWLRVSTDYRLPRLQPYRHGPAATADPASVSPAFETGRDATVAILCQYRGHVSGYNRWLSDNQLRVQRSRRRLCRVQAVTHVLQYSRCIDLTARRFLPPAASKRRTVAAPTIITTRR